MRKRLGKRALFFGLIAIICMVLVPATPAQFRWVAWASAALAGFWAIMFTIEDMLGPEGPRGEAVLPAEVPFEPETPFPPPPPPRGVRR